MYYKNFYANCTESEIEKMIRGDGFDPMKFSNSAGDIYQLHQHPETKLLVFLEGTMEVVAAGEKFSCTAGDKLVIPGNAPHSAVVGPSGCTFFWSEKLI